MSPATSAATLAPVAGGERIAVLDVLRGFAILSILYLNIGQMGVPRGALFGDGWSGADWWTFATIRVLVDGTQRGMLELLFGAGMMVIARHAMRPDGPVGVADVYLRRNLWLLVFGMVDVFVLLWTGDILHVYALAALLLFPFRHLSPRWLVVLGLSFAAWSAVEGYPTYRDAVTLEQRVAMAQGHERSGSPVTAADRAALTEWRQPALSAATRERAATATRREIEARQGGVATYARFHWRSWQEGAESAGWLMHQIWDALCVMLLGVALWKWGVIQGERSSRFYALLVVIGYGFGVGCRLVDLPQLLAMSPRPRLDLMLGEFARIGVTLGHLALINLVMRAAAGRRLLSPFRAAGQMAFSLYLLQSLLCMWVIFAPWGPGLWGRYDWAGLAVIATCIDAALLIAANLWLGRFASGPFEWLWRSLSYAKRQPMRR